MLANGQSGRGPLPSGEVGALRVTPREGLGHRRHGPGGATALTSLETTCRVYPKGYIIAVRILTTNVYLDWINGLKDVVLLAGGDKSSQQRDIELAMELARNLGDESEW